MIRFLKNAPFDAEFIRDLEILMKKYFREADENLNMYDYIMFWSRFSDWDDRLRKFLDDIALGAFNYYQTYSIDKDYYVVEEKPKVILDIVRKDGETPDARFSLMWLYHLKNENCSYAIETDKRPIWTILSTNHGAASMNWHHLIPDYEGFFSTRKPLPGTSFDEFKIEHIPNMNRPNLDGLDAKTILENEPVSPEINVTTGRKFDKTGVRLAPGAQPAPKGEGTFEDWKPMHKVYEAEKETLKDRIKHECGAEDFEPVDWHEYSKKQEEENGIHTEECDGDFTKAYARRSYSKEFQEENRKDLEESYSIGKTDYNVDGRYRKCNIEKPKKQNAPAVSVLPFSLPPGVNEGLFEDKLNEPDIVEADYTTSDIFNIVCAATKDNFEGFKETCQKQYPDAEIKYITEYTTIHEDVDDIKFKFTLSAKLPDSTKVFASVTTIYSFKDNNDSRTN